MLAFIARKICRRVGKIDVDDVPHTLPQLFMYFLQESCGNYDDNAERSEEYVCLEVGFG